MVDCVHLYSISITEYSRAGNVQDVGVSTTHRSSEVLISRTSFHEVGGIKLDTNWPGKKRTKC